MIDWFSVSFSALWIFGLGFVTAGFSLAIYLASQQKQRFELVLEMSAFRTMINPGLALFCPGWTGSAVGTWERIVWAVMALILVVQTWQSRKKGSA
jgi:hypothetical protein